MQNGKQRQIIGQKHLLILTHTEISVFRASQGEKADNTLDSQVVQYEPAHQGSINTVTNLSPDLCVSGGSDQVNSSGFKTSTRNKSTIVLFERKSESSRSKVQTHTVTMACVIVPTGCGRVWLETRSDVSVLSGPQPGGYQGNVTIPPVRTDKGVWVASDTFPLLILPRLSDRWCATQEVRGSSVHRGTRRFWCGTWIRGTNLFRSSVVMS